jgi:type I restriction enzyme M protein
MSNHNEISSFIWNVCDDVLRGLFKQHEYGDVILPFVVLRRLDCVLEGKKDEIISTYEQYKSNIDSVDRIVQTRLNLKFFNHSKYDLVRLKDEPNKIQENLNEYLQSFSSNVNDIIKNFGLEKHIDKLGSNNKLYLLVEKFTEVNLHPSVVDNHTMGNIFEELLRRFSEMSNETSGEHYTPRDVVQLLVSMVFSPDKEKLSDPNKLVSIYDPCCGTGGMLTIGKDWVNENLMNNTKESNKPS